MVDVTNHVPFSVSGKSAIITGAGSGINLEFAQLLLDRDCNVVFADLSLRTEAQVTVDGHAKAKNGRGRAVFIKTDVTRWDDLNKMFDVAETEFGGADIVCPGAGIFEPHWSNFWHPPGTAESRDSVHGTATEGLGHYAIFDINTVHPIRTTQIAISRWLNPAEGSRAGKASQSNPKRVVHLASIAGQVPSFPTALYIASKHALVGFIRSMGMLDKVGIRINGVAPAAINTPLWTDHPEKLQMMDLTVDVLIEPSECAEAMLRCCEDPEIDGGYVMEVTKDRTRKVEWKNDPGPSGGGTTIGNGKVMVEEVFGWLSKPGWGVPEL
ncbi:NAD(P)-binding protein [Polychaeton citri CBS 116435]|uniref:NAD(P)-binding protein n=1 Tax=Polychaeton citri CBS 116435 TaxID=1314669 RepID=A0A9P4QFA1_9PEZI|nr:NAD(P)-binding protein [Polychaeton citri CBS 116435]